jgi:hydrogenase expression/formation protein HypC
MRVTEISGEMGRVEAGGISREVCLALLGEIEIGDFVLVHAGFAIERLDQSEARATLKLLGDLMEDT